VEKSNAAKLIGVTELGKMLPPPAPPSRLAVQKEMDRMETERQNLNAMEKIAPNPLYEEKSKDKKLPKKDKKSLKTGMLNDLFKDLSKEDIEKLITAFAESGADPKTKAIQDMVQGGQAADNIFDRYANNLALPSFESYQTPTPYRFPGFFNG